MSSPAVASVPRPPRPGLLSTREAGRRRKETSGSPRETRSPRSAAAAAGVGSQARLDPGGSRLPGVSEVSVFLPFSWSFRGGLGCRSCRSARPVSASAAHPALSMVEGKALLFFLDCVCISFTSTKTTQNGVFKNRC